MYKDFFNLSAEPFRVTPDPGFLFLTEQHKEALAAIIYGISKRKGFVCITGEVGVGKTTILRSYLDTVDEPGLRFVYIFNPNTSFLALLRHIFREIGLASPGDEIAEMVETLRRHLLERHQRHETLVLLVDEAQNMPINTLESLRLLSNLETATEKLVQIVLVGQPELEQLLAERQLRQLESRIAVRTRLGPLSRADSAAYIRHRLKCVALDDSPAFSDRAIRLVAARAEGIPRRINVLCDTALMTAFGRKIKPVSVAIMREVLKDFGPGQVAAADKRARPAWPRRLGWTVAVGAGATLAAAFWLRGLEPPVATPPVAIVDAAPRIQVSLPLLPPSAPPPAAAPAEPAGDRRLRIVAPGDTLLGLATQVYGAADRERLEWVKSHNPEILSIDRIQVGQVIEFPALPGKGGR